ncbi:MAG: hypothetical protein IJ890_03620 [Clostridia bacterium]|nr:hypothetical protein [Clostridia bacterium]
MRYNTQEKSLIEVNENSIFYKIKCFFRSLFHKNKIAENSTIIENVIEDSIENNKNSFIESIKNVEDEETLIIKLQNKYRNGEIKEEDMTEEQINSLCNLYDKQIAKLKKSNNLRKQKLLEYRKNL